MTIAAILVAHNFDDDGHKLFNDPTYCFNDNLLVGRATGQKSLGGPHQYVDINQ